ncbi:RING finger protein 17 isoform X1 [Danio rerio]|uniref:RING finger protein 17 n=1 Tax=Danio rerio TaxID=7955 RepID=F1R3C5_DANRE|nr:RING finger protein 17 [Danio rerio]XP_697454.3 RING finger protein 17 [Danio rerio]|eukprot:XP_021334643.1 RING finger protein 17 [Danio rerio]
MSETAVTCKICGSPYTLPEDEAVGNLPHVLLCGHIFCCTCLRALQSQGNVITCPECQMDTRTSEEGVDGLEVDSRIIGLIYTARMNTKKGHSGDKWKSQKFKSPPSSAAVHTEENAEGKPDVVKVLDEALTKATENLNQLDKLHQTLANGVHGQLRKERSRIIREIDEAVEKAKSILLKRRSMLVSTLSSVDLLFSGGQMECKRIEERIKELRTAIQKARHVRQVPSLETYCDLEKILETLHIPVDLESYDMSSLTLRSGLSCHLQVDGFTESVKVFLKITDTDDNCIVEEITVEPFQHVVKSGVEMWDNSSQSVQGKADAIPRKSNNTRRFMEKMMEDTCPEIADTRVNAGLGRNLPVHEPRRMERYNKGYRKQRRPQFEKPTNPQPKLVQYVVTTHIVNPGHFYVRYMAEHKLGQKLTKKISEFCSGERSFFTFSDEITTGSLLFISWKDDMWCRVKVTELFQKECFQSVTKCLASEVSRLCVYFLDYGFFKGFSIPSDGGLSGLNECLRRPDGITLIEMANWAPLAIKCSLKDIIPADLVKGWSSEASEEMRNVLRNETAEMQVFGEDGDALLVDLKKTSMADLKKNSMVSLREHLVFMELARFYCPVITTGSAPLLFYPSVQPSLNVEVNAMVSHVNTPSDFYVQLVENTEYPLLHSKLQDCYNQPKSNNECQVYCPSLSQACVAFHDQEWSRVQVTGFPGGRMVEVRFVDFGYKRTLSVKDLRHIKDEFFVLPEMALWCNLNDVISSQETWANEACESFKELVEGKLMTVVAKKNVPSSKPVPVCLFEISDDCTGASIGDELVKKGYAVYNKDTQVRDAQPLETTSWDPPFEEEALPVVMTPSSASEELKPSLSLPSCLKDIRVRVTHVTSPGNICVQLLQFDNQLKRIHDTLKNLFSKSEPQEMQWEAEMYCAVNNTGVWERGQVCSVSTCGVAEVLRCDFGNTVKLHVDNLRPLHPDLIGSFLLECNLSGVRPAGGRSTWTATACDFISHYLTGAMALMAIKEPSTRPVLVSLFCSNRAGQNVSFADFLISEGLALKERKAEMVFSEESVLVTEPQPVISPTQTPPTPSRRINPPPERVKTHSYPPPELPPCGHILMSISAVSEQGVIYAMTHQAVCEFDRLRERLQQHIKTLPRQKNYNWKGVLGCAVMGTDMFWYRGQVQEVIGGHVKVRYVDQGLVESIPVCHVYPMVLCEDVPQLCVPCQINGVLPIGKGWQWDAVVLMKELLLGRSVNVQIMEHPKDPCGCVTVEIMVDGMALSKIMVHHQYATFDPAISSQEDYVVKPPMPDLDDWDLNTEGLEEQPPVLGVYKELHIPKERKHFPAKVKHIRTPNEVFLCVLDKSLCKLEQDESMEETLEQVNENIENLSLLTDFPIECLCLAEYSDGKYYRAKILGFSEVTPSVKLLVRHVDFGSDDIIPLHKLRQLPASLHHFPCAAVYVKLAGFKPTNVSSDLERIPYSLDWTMKAMMEMIDLLNGELTAVVTATKPQLTVLLYNADGTLVHTPLVEKGLADYE